MSIKKLSFMLMIVMSLAAFLYGCGTSNKDSAISASNVAKVDEASCAQCHGSSRESLTGRVIYDDFTQSVHQLNSVGCQDCHGGGSQHNGVGPIPFAKPTQEQCRTCHDTDALVTKFSTSRHAEGRIREGVTCNRCHSHQGAVLAAQSGLGFTGDKNVLAAGVTAGIAPGALPTGTGMSIQCTTCHVTHDAKKLRIDAGWQPSDDVGSVVASTNDQYRLCTQCHSYTNPAGKLVGTGTVLSIANSVGVFSNVSTVPFYHNERWKRTMPTTHYDQTVSNAVSGGVIEGYVIRKKSANPCFDCHSHEFKANTGDQATRGTTTYTDWAESAHAGKLLKQKAAAAASQTNNAAQIDAVMRAGVTEASGAGWIHYNWDDTASRGSCQRCHTSTGASNFMKSPSTYVANGTGNTFTHLTNWSATGGSPQNELLYCWGCHTNSGKGTLYAPGARTETYAAIVNAGTGTTGTAAVIAYPDIKGSNVCMTCHVGREVGENIKNTTDADGVLSFINSHYLTAGATLFGQSGYTYAGRSYTAPNFFAHDKIGTTAQPGTGTNGPCVTCHMTSPKKHLFTNVSTNTSGVITKITSTSCVSCHTGANALTATSLETEHEDYKAAIAALNAALAAKGIHFFEAHPYFYAGAGGTGGAFTNWGGPYGVAFWKDTMGAAFNLNLLLHDPGGYAHNRFYAKRLIWDSIDFIDNGVLDDSVPAELTLRLSGQQLIDAQTYLGATRP